MESVRGYDAGDIPPWIQGHCVRDNIFHSFFPRAPGELAFRLLRRAERDFSATTCTVRRAMRAALSASLPADTPRRLLSSQSRISREGVSRRCFLAVYFRPDSPSVGKISRQYADCDKSQRPHRRPRPRRRADHVVIRGRITRNHGDNTEGTRETESPRGAGVRGSVSLRYLTLSETPHQPAAIPGRSHPGFCSLSPRGVVSSTVLSRESQAGGAQEARGIHGT